MNTGGAPTPSKVSGRADGVYLFLKAVRVTYLAVLKGSVSLVEGRSRTYSSAFTIEKPKGASPNQGGVQGDLSLGRCPQYKLTGSPTLDS